VDIEVWVGLKDWVKGNTPGDGLRFFSNNYMSWMVSLVPVVYS